MIEIPRIDIPDAELEARRRAAAEAFELAAPEAAQDNYDREVFRWAAEAMRRVGAGNRPAKIAFVPVGTQPYAPILAALASPAEIVVLLHTDGSLPHAELVRAAIAPERPVLRLRSIGDGLDGAAIAAVVVGERASAGDPRPADVVADVTGGRKATVAVLGALAAANGFRQTYVEGRPSARHRAFFVGERWQAVINVRALCGVDRRERGIALWRAGGYAAAAKELAAASEATGGARDAASALAAQGLDAFRAGDFGAAARRFGAASRLFARDDAARLALEDGRAVASEIARGGAALRRHALLAIAESERRGGDRLAAAAAARAAGLRAGTTLATARRAAAAACGVERARLALHDPRRLAASLAPSLGLED